MDVSANQELWSQLTVPNPESGEGDLTYFDANRRPIARIEGSKGGFFEIGWLEGRRARRQMYRVQWSAVPAEAVVAGDAVLLGAVDLRHQLRSAPTALRWAGRQRGRARMKCR